MTIHTSQGSWVVPPHRAAWVPAFVEHSVEMSGPVSMRTLYLAPGLSPDPPRECCTVNVPPLLRELILEAVNRGMLRRDVPSEGRLIAVMMDQIEALPAAPLQLPMPRDARARKVADLLRANPAEAASLERIAKQVGASPRTLERLFRSEANMAFGKWRQRLRLLHALRLLAAGNPLPPWRWRPATTVPAPLFPCSSANWGLRQAATTRLDTDPREHPYQGASRLGSSSVYRCGARTAPVPRSATARPRESSTSRRVRKWTSLFPRRRSK